MSIHFVTQSDNVQYEATILLKGVSVHLTHDTVAWFGLCL
jgi:hypothetical protein